MRTQNIRDMVVQLNVPVPLLRRIIEQYAQFLLEIGTSSEVKELLSLMEQIPDPVVVVDTDLAQIKNNLDDYLKDLEAETQE